MCLSGPGARWAELRSATGLLIPGPADSTMMWHQPNLRPGHALAELSISQQQVASGPEHPGHGAGAGSRHTQLCLPALPWGSSGELLNLTKVTASTAMTRVITSLVGYEGWESGVKVAKQAVAPVGAGFSLVAALRFSRGRPIPGCPGAPSPTAIPCQVVLPALALPPSEKHKTCHGKPCGCCLHHSPCLTPY